MKNKKILIISYYWPPSGSVGVQRWLNYAIQLKKIGWEPIIYTPENPLLEIKDGSLLEKVRNIRVVKKKIWEPFKLFNILISGGNRGKVSHGLGLGKRKTRRIDRLMIWIRGNLFIPDPRIFWIRPSTKFLTKFIREEKIGLMITTGPPHSMHLIGLKLKKKIDVKWLADFRDPWSTWDVLNLLKVGKWARKKHMRLEQSVLQNCDRILSVTPQMSKELSLISSRVVKLIYNGVSIEPITPKKLKKKLIIGYFGSLNEMRNPPELWDALEAFSTNNEIEFRIGGIISDFVKKQIERHLNLYSKTVFLNYLDHSEVVEEYKKCDILILLQNRTENAKWIIPLKFYEYLAINRRILIIGSKNSDLEKLSRGLPSFQMIEFGDFTGIKEMLDFFGSEIDFLPAQRLLQNFSHEKLANELNDQLEEMMYV